MVTDIRRLVRLPTAALAAAVLATTTVARADDNEDVLSLRHYLRQTWQTAEGLPQNSVRTIAQTPEGYLWFGTAEGLVRFDGNRFTVYDRTSTPALPSGNIKSLAVAADGALWIGFRRHGLARLHGGRLTRWTTTEGLSGNEILSLLTTPDGSIWAGATSQGLNRIRDGRVTTYRREQGLPDNDGYAVTAAPSGGVLVGTATGVAHVSDAGVRQISLLEGERPAPVMAILEQSGGLWLGTPTGLWHLEERRQRRYTTADGLPSDDVTALVPGRDGTLWIGMRSGGLARLRDGRFESYTIADGLPNDFVHALYEDREIAEAQPLAPVRRPIPRTARPLAVLLAEDGRVNQLLVTRILEKAGHAVTVVETCAQAVDALARAHYDAVLMDIQMPEMDGFEATLRIRARELHGRRRVPVIAITAHAMEGDRERCLAAGMDGYISKPIRPDVLLASLAEHTETPCEDRLAPPTTLTAWRPAHRQGT